MGSRRRDRSDELRKVASNLYRLMREREIATTRRLKIDSKVTHILNHSSEYQQLRLRGKVDGRKAKDPAFLTLVDIASELEVPLCALMPTIDHQAITAPEREVLTRVSRWILGKFAKRQEERVAYQSDVDDFEAYVTVRKQAFPSAASPTGADEQLEPEDVEVLKAIPGILEDRFQVTTVRGDSMTDRLHPGDRVLVDVSRRKPLEGEIVVVDRGHLGRTIGYWYQRGDRCYLEKHNGATINLGSADDWQILGTVTRIVDAPLLRRERKKAG